MEFVAATKTLFELSTETPRELPSVENGVVIQPFRFPGALLFDSWATKLEFDVTQMLPGTVVGEADVASGIRRAGTEPTVFEMRTGATAAVTVDACGRM